MDEVDVQNSEDLNELETHLYGQIHHETMEAERDEVYIKSEIENETLLIPMVPTNVCTQISTSAINNCNEGNTLGHNWDRVQQPTELLETQEQFQSNKNATKEVTNGNNMDSDVPNKGEGNTPEINKPKDSAIMKSSNKKNSSPRQNQASAKKLPFSTTKTNFKTKQKPNEQLTNKNPVDIQKNIPHNPANTKQQQKSQQHNSKHAPIPNMRRDGPFAKQIQKLDKAKRIDAKRQKSIVAKTKMKNRTKEMKTIVILSSDESEGDGEDDDVIAIQPPPPPMYVIDDDSDEENKNKNENEGTDFMEVTSEQNVHETEEIREDTNHQLTNKSSNNARHQVATPQNNSRCVSPSSIVSSDDFIGQNDRCRLQKTSVMADDEDLIMLTTDFDSLMEAPEVVSKTQRNSLNQNNAKEANVEMHDKQQSAGPKDTGQDIQMPEAYETEGSEEPEGEESGRNRSKKQTIIRSISNSSASSSHDDSDDSDNDVTVPSVMSKKTWHLFKKFLSRNQKKIPSSSLNKKRIAYLKKTGVPFIGRGPAVERCKLQSSIDSQTIKKKIRKSGGTKCVNVQTADNQFIANINSLSQGDAEVTVEQEQEENGNSDVSDDEEVPSARSIAEQVLTAQKNKVTQMRTSAGVVTEQIVTTNSDTEAESQNPITTQTIQSTPTAALPDETLSNLSNIFDTIDNLDRKQQNQSSGPDDDEETMDDFQLKRKNDVKNKKKMIKLLTETSDPVYNIVYSEEKRFSGGLGWNDEMRRFYNDSWKGEHFNVRNILKSMNPDKNLWRIYTEDRFPPLRKKDNRKCYNCCEFGHTRSKCTRPRKPRVCYMCGEQGHYEPRCPNTVCLRCGNKTQVYTKSCNACTFQNRLICPICKVRGHTLNLCPDKWRRYHSTTEPNLYPNNEVEYKKKKFCCICGARGHISDTCKSAVRFLEYPLFVSDIKSHQKSYNDQSFRTTTSGIGYNLLYKPDEDVSFELAENCTSTDYYGRFLNSVGMSYLLNRKRKPGTISLEECSKAKKPTQHEAYVVNPYSKAGSKQRHTIENESASAPVLITGPEQVQEISESGNVDRIIGDDNIGEEQEEAEEDYEEEHAIEEDTNSEVINTAQTIDGSSGAEEHDENTDIEDLERTTNNDDPQQIQTAECTLTNTQIPDHSTPSQTSKQNQIADLGDLVSQNNVSALLNKPTSNSKEKNSLPDFIPLDNSSSSNDEDVFQNHFDLDTGISKNFVALESDDDSDKDDNHLAATSLGDLPCEAKIYLTHFHSKYLLSPPGHKFLMEKSKECNIIARLDWTSVGHVLIIFGMQSNQDRFHRELLLKYRQLTDQMNQKHLVSVQKVPKRVDAIVRFLREDINQLMKSLGNVNQLLKRLKFFEAKQLSKQGRKLNAQIRRSLNMILVGQAGLRDGNYHLDKLLLILKKLVNDYKDEELASDELRNEIDQHWKVIFTPFRHDNYSELVQHYNKMLNKNRLPKLNIDPILLGKDPDTGEPNSGKDKLKVRSEKEKDKSSLVPNPLNPRNSKQLSKSPPKSLPASASQMTIPHSLLSPNSTAPPAPSMKTMSRNDLETISNFVPPTNSLKLKNFSAAPSVNTENKKSSAKWEIACNSLLKEIDINMDNISFGPERDSKAPSIFWSKESTRYINECIKEVTANTDLMERLQRVLNKSQSGLLSYNDYRAVIKIHNTIFKK